MPYGFYTHQLDVDLPRLDVIIDGKRIIDREQMAKAMNQVTPVSSNDLYLLRCCTQSVFAPALEYLTKVFPTVYILDNKERDKSQIIVNNKPVYFNKPEGFLASLASLLSGVQPTIKYFETDCIISTYFTAVTQYDLEPCFVIYMQLFFNLESNTGTLLFQLIKPVNM